MIKQGLSVRQTEKLAKTGTKKAPSNDNVTPAKDADTRALELDLAAALGMRLSIDHTPGKESGTLTVKYKTLEELDELCRKLSVTTGAGEV